MKRSGFPKFKTKETDRLRFRIPQRVTLDAAFVRVPKIGLIKARIHRPMEGISKGATFKQEPDGHWYVCFVVEQTAPDRTERPVKTHVGVDLGLKTFAVMSDGVGVPNPRFYRRQMRKLRGAVHNRDLNAAHNIDTKGMRLFAHYVAVGHTETQNACGVLVRPAKAGAGR